MRKTEKLWTRDYCFLFIISSLQNIQNQLTGPIMSRFGRDSGFALGLTGLVVGVFSVASLLTRPASGKLADKANNKILVIVSSLLTAAATLGYAVFGTNPSVLLALRFLHGVGFGASGTILMRMASLLIPDSRMGEGMGLFGLGQVLAVAVAPGIALFLVEQFGYSTAFTAGAALVAATAFLCLFIRTQKVLPKLVPPVPQGKKGFFARFLAPQVLPLSFMACTLFFANSIEVNFIILYGEALGLGAISSYFLVGAAAMLGVRLIGGRLMDRLGPNKILGPSILLVCVSLLLLSAAGLPSLRNFAFPLFLAASVIKGLGHAAAQPCIQAACVQLVPQEKRGLAAGTFYMGCDLGMGLGPMVGGAAAGVWGFPALYLLGALVALTGLFGLRKRK